MTDIGLCGTTGYGLIAWAKGKNAYYNSKAGHLEHGHDE